MVTTFLMLVFCSRRVALSAGLLRVNGQSAIGPLVLRALPILGRRSWTDSRSKEPHFRR